MLGTHETWVAPRHWQLLTASQVISLCSQGWELLTKEGDPRQILFTATSSSLGVYGCNPAKRFSRHSFTAAACSQPHPELGARANNSRLPTVLLAAWGCLIGFPLSLSTCCQSKKLGKLKWNPSICLCGSKLGDYAKKMSLAFNKATLEIPLSALSRLDTSAPAPTTTGANLLNQPCELGEMGVIQMQGCFLYFVSFSFRGMQNV